MSGPFDVRVDADRIGTIRFIGRFVARRWGRYAWLFALIVGAAGCAVAVQYSMKLLVDAMASGQRGDPAVWQWLGVFATLIAVESALWRGAGWLGAGLIVATGVDVRMSLFRHLAGHSLGFFTQHFAGALGNRVTGTAGAMGSVMGTLTWKIVPPVVDFIGALVVLATIDYRLVLALAGSVFVVAAVVSRFGWSGKPLHRAYAARAAQVAGELVDLVAHIWTLKAFSAVDRESRRLQDSLAGEARAQRHSWRHLEKSHALHDVLLVVMAGAMLAWSLHGWSGGHLSMGDVVVISALTFRILHGSRDLALAVVDMEQQFGIIAEALAALGGDHAVEDTPGAEPFRPAGGAVQILHASYAYPDGHRVFDHLRLEIPAGQRCGIVGASGAGKSTLLALLQRLDDVQGGCIRIDGQDLRHVRQDSLRAGIAVVPQDVALLHRSVFENIRFGRPDASDAEVRAAARAAGCEAFIAALPEGSATLVGERGTRLSGGQRQRIGIARAFLKRAPVLLLDEATSALDSESERQVQQALDGLMHGRTVVSVAHRLSTVDGLDRIVVLDGGRIVEDGAPTVLRGAGGPYEKLWRLQAMRDEEDDVRT